MSVIGACRRKRANVQSFDVQATTQELVPLANVKKHAFTWDGSTYNRPRGRAPEREALNMHAPVLRALIKNCPSGYLGQGQTVEVLTALHNKYNIFHNRADKALWVVAGEVA